MTVADPRGATAALPIPETGATTALPVPETGATVGRGLRRPVPHLDDAQQADAEAYSLSAGEFSKGARSAANSLGATVVGLAGAIGDAMGTDEFAARRWAEAEDFLAMANAVGPRVRDYRTVKDMTDTVDLVSGFAGQAAVFMAPALVGGGAAGLAGAGLRGATAVAAGSSFVPEAGESALGTRDLPGTPLKKLGVNLGKGAVNAAIDVLPIGRAFSTLSKAKKGIKTGGALKELGVLAGGEAITEGVQEKVGQAAQGILDPDRDTSEDTPEAINAAIQGLVGGTGLGLGTVGGAKLALRMRDRPVDPDDFTDVPEDVSKIPDYLTAKDESFMEGLKRDFARDPKKYAQYEGFEEDADLQDEFKNQLAEDYATEVDTPAAKERVSKLQKFVDKLRGKKDGEKKSQMRTKVDLEVHDNVMKHLPVTSEGLSSGEKLQLSDGVRQYVMHTWGAREATLPESTAGGVVQSLQRGNEHASLAQAQRGQSPTKAIPLPDALVEEFGDQLPALLSSTFDILKKGGSLMGRKPNFKRGVKRAAEGAKRDFAGLEAVVAGNLVEDAQASEQVRATVVPELTRRIRAHMDNPNTDVAQFKADMKTAFGDNADAVMEAFEKERERITRGHGSFDEVPGDADQTELEAEDRDANPKQSDVWQDERLKKAYREGPELQEAMDALRDPGSGYDQRAVKFSVEPEISYDEDGVAHMTGRQFIRAEDAAAKVGFTPEEMGRISEKKKKGGIKHSVVSMVVKDQEHPGRNTTMAVSLPNLFGEVSRTFTWDCLLYTSPSPRDRS